VTQKALKSIWISGRRAPENRRKFYGGTFFFGGHCITKQDGEMKTMAIFLLDRLNPEYQINLWTNSWSTQFQQAHFLMSGNHSASYILDLQNNS
jgi:hypothetical protein